MDAPTGFGKTYLLIDHIRHYGKNSRVMVIVSWKSLCNYYKGLLEKETNVSWSLYSDRSDHESRICEWDPVKNPRVIICYPSLK